MYRILKLKIYYNNMKTLALLVIGLCIFTLLILGYYDIFSKQRPLFIMHISLPAFWFMLPFLLFGIFFAYKVYKNNI